MSDNGTPSCPISDGYVLDPETSDEFNGTELDKAKWWDYAPKWRGRREFLYSHENVRVRNGCLELLAKAVPEESMAYEDRCDGIWPYTMPIVKSRKKVTYGYFECRSRGTAAEVRNAFWLYDPLSGSDLPKKYRPGSHSEEIDIYEFIGKYEEPLPISNAVCSHVHRFETPYIEGVVNSQKTELPNPGGVFETDWPPLRGLSRLRPALDRGGARLVRRRRGVPPPRERLLPHAPAHHVRLRTGRLAQSPHRHARPDDLAGSAQHPVLPALGARVVLRSTKTGNTERNHDRKTLCVDRHAVPSADGTVVSGGSAD
jgi:hypothetical protein